MAAYSRDTWLTTFQTHGVDTSRMSSPRPIVALHPRHKLHPLTRHPASARRRAAAEEPINFAKLAPAFVRLTSGRRGIAAEMSPTPSRRPGITAECATTQPTRKRASTSFRRWCHTRESSADRSWIDKSYNSFLFGSPSRTNSLNDSARRFLRAAKNASASRTRHSVGSTGMH